MKRNLLMLLLVLTSICYGNEVEKNSPKPKDNRILFITGIGSSVILTDLYQNPAVNLSNNNIIIEESQKIKTNVSLGISYTPFRTKITYIDGQEEIVPHGLSFATFINPISLNSSTENQSFFNMTDFGVGVGYKFARNIIIMGTIEWLNVRQPRNWFVNEYKGNDRPFVVNDSPQLSFDINDNNIFETKIATTLGFKICYSFDILKDFKESPKNK